MSAEVFRDSQQQQKEVIQNIKENTTKIKLVAIINSHSLCSFKNARDKTK